MARKKKWTVPFMSLNGTSCRVDIYEEGYTSSTVTELSINNANAPGYASAVPFEFSDDDSNDLTHFVRFKTGFLRLKELTYGSLDGLMPRNITDHYVEAYYGTSLVFTGYMQCQEFDNDFVAAPREIVFPVISPLGLLSAFNFNVPSQPGLVTLGSLMYEVIQGLNAGYTDVIYPKNQETAPWDNVISSTVMVPFNSQFRHYDTANDLYKPNDYLYYIDGLCACNGWMVHDTPTSIVFTKFEYTDSYTKMTNAGLIASNPSSYISWLQQRSAVISNYYENIDNNAMQSVVMPLKKITLSLEGAGIKDKSLNTDHTTSNGLAEGGENFRAIKMTQVGPDVTGDVIGTAIMTTGGEISNNGLFPLAYGKVESGAKSANVSDSWVIKYSTSWTGGQSIITAKFYGQAPKNNDNYCLIKMEFERGTTLQDMKDRDYDSFRLNLVIKCGDKYYNLTNDSWGSSSVLNQITIDGSTGKVTPNKQFPTGPNIGYYTDIADIDGILFTLPYGINAPVELSLYKNTTMDLNNNDYLRIRELSLKNPGAFTEPYYNFYNNEDEIVVGNNATGTEDKGITVNFNNYSSRRGENLYGTTANGNNGTVPTYLYMFSPVNVITQKVRRIASPDFNEYAARWGYFVSGWRWRMIAQNFNLRDDEYQITLARSWVIDA